MEINTNNTIQGNRPLRFFASMMLIILLIAHLTEAVDLTNFSVLWFIIFMSINALQASFTGFCPMFKDKEGKCVACGVQCSDSETSTENTQNKSSGCCDESGNNHQAECCQSNKDKCK